jgi:signal recognition particle subunit SRP54
MTLDKLSSSLQDSMRRLLKLSVIDKAAVKELVKDLQRALLQADVNVKLVLEISHHIEERSLHEKIPPGVSRKEHVIKVLYDELARFLGEKPAKLPIDRGITNVIMLVGIQGSGKTTTSVKLARFLRKRGIKTALVCADTYRPGAYAQLKQLASTANIPVYGEEDNQDPLEISKRGVEFFRKDRYDAIVVDTAGRHKDEDSLIHEMKNIASLIAPNQIMMVIDGTIGQQAITQAEAFHQATKIGSIVVSKLDGSARGGGALSAVAATGAPVTFIGTGEKVEDLELFAPPRFAGRLLGMGDLRGLIEKVREAEITVPEDTAKAMMSGQITLTGLLDQLEGLRKLGPLGKIMKMIPGLGFDLSDAMERVSEEKMDRWKAIIHSMTPQERENPKILNASRMRRIARGSGSYEKDVKDLVRQFEMMKKMMKGMRRRHHPFKALEKKMLREFKT